MLADLGDGVELSKFWSEQELELFSHEESEPMGGGDGDGDSDGDLEYQVVIECDNKQHQKKLMTQLKGEGLTCRAEKNSID